MKTLKIADPNDVQATRSALYYLLEAVICLKHVGLGHVAAPIQAEADRLEELLESWGVRLYR